MMVQSATVTQKRGSFRRNVIATFLMISIISLGVTGVVSLGFVDLIGGFTTDESTTALEGQIRRNMETTAEQTALVINQKLASAEAMVRSMGVEIENLFDAGSTFHPRQVYYDYFFENPGDGPHPADTAYDANYGISVSWESSSWYLAGSNTTNYDDVYLAQADKLDPVSNMDTLFAAIHDQVPEFRWLYMAFENNLFINYPGSILGADTDAERNIYAEQWRPTEDGWYQAIRAGGGSIVYEGPYYDPIDQVLILSIGRAVYFENMTLMGVIAGDISIEDVKDQILDVQILETGFAALITSDGDIVAHKNVDDADYVWYDPNLPPLTDFEVNSDASAALTTTQMLQITSGATGIINYQKDGAVYLLAYTPVDIGGYICIIIVPVEEALESIPLLEARIAQGNTAAISFILIVTLGGIILAGVVAATVTNSITRPLQYLMSLAMRNVEAMIKQGTMDTLDLRVDATYIEQDDEIGELARAFQGMLDTIGDED